MLFKKKPEIAGIFLLVGCLLFSLSCDKRFGQQFLYNKGRNLHDHGHLDQAIEIYRQVLEMPGDHSQVNYDLGVAYADKGDINSAKKQVQILQNSDRPDLADVLLTVIRDSDSSRVRKRLQGEYNAQQDKKN